jgi:hypothetical protein
MAFVSLTRLRVRSALRLPQFYWHSFRSMRQARRARGFLGGRVLGEADRTFWTVTAWESAEAMREYRNADAHGRAMPKLLEWCDEASVAHWEQEGAELPTWHEAHARMAAEGRPSKVRHPSPAHEARQVAEPRAAAHAGFPLKPAVKGN